MNVILKILTLLTLLFFPLRSSAILAVEADPIDNQFGIIEQVGPQGVGSEKARHASDNLRNRGTAILPRLLVAMDTRNIVAANWLRSVYEEVVDTELSKKAPRLPLEMFQKYLHNTKRQGRVRRLVLTTIDRVDPTFRSTFIPTRLDDPEFRGDAILAVLKQGDDAKKNGQTDKARQDFLNAFQHARLSSQIITAADRLKSVGHEVNIATHMGFVTHWYVLGPFDAPGKSGFKLSFPPEKNIDLKAEYDGKNNQRIHWKLHHTVDRLGLVNLVQAIAPATEAVGFAYAELHSNRTQTAQVRCGADDNLTVWLNGEKVFSRLQWLNGTRLDRFTASVRLKKGNNRLLVKICQGPQHKNPAVSNNWSMQLRFCTDDGAGIALKPVVPSIAQKDGESQ